MNRSSRIAAMVSCGEEEKNPARSAEGMPAAMLVHFGICTSSLTCSAVKGAGMNFPATASAMI